AKPGRFELADQGTLLLDELGELEPTLQAKLLRVLEDGEIQRLGSTASRKVDVRIVAATNRELHRETREGRFRSDLYYRLSVFPIELPPLRDRRDDIVLLVEHFIERNNGRLGTKIRDIDQPARKLLLNYPWPGNVRELENTIERAVVLAEGDTITVGDLPERMREPADPVAASLSNGELSIKKTARFMEETLIQRALHKTGGNRTAAAKLLEISHRALLYKIKDYGIQ
ncbi:MAG: sigma 54-interacting transcriptional regulator, partial [Polyangiales bacterium]